MLDSLQLFIERLESMTFNLFIYVCIHFIAIIHKEKEKIKMIVTLCKSTMANNHVTDEYQLFY